MTPLFAVETALTQADLQAFRTQQMARLARATPRPSWLGHIVVGFVVALCSTLVLVAARIVSERQGGPIAALVAASYFVGVMTHGAILARSRQRSYGVAWQSSPFAEAVRRYAITEDGIDVAGGDTSAQWRWAAFTEAELGRGMLCLWVGYVSGLGIPLRAFTDRAEAERATAFAQAQIARARAA